MEKENRRKDAAGRIYVKKEWSDVNPGRLHNIRITFFLYADDIVPLL